MTVAEDIAAAAVESRKADKAKQRYLERLENPQDLKIVPAARPKGTFNTSDVSRPK